MRFSWRFLIDIAAPAFCVCWIGYFAYGAVLGATGVRALNGVEAELAAKTAELDEITARRRQLETVANQLNPKSLDPDMVDEKIRSVLGFVAEEDMVVPRDQFDEMLREAANTGR